MPKMAKAGLCDPASGQEGGFTQSSLHVCTDLQTRRRAALSTWQGAYEDDISFWNS